MHSVRQIDYTGHTTPRATRVGELSQMDGWDAQVTSLLGNKHMLDMIDEYSSDIEVYFAKMKSDFPRCELLLIFGTRNAWRKMSSHL